MTPRQACRSSLGEATGQARQGGAGTAGLAPGALLRKRALSRCPCPPRRTTQCGWKAPGSDWPTASCGGQKLTERDIITYLAHSRVTEQGASEQMRALRKYAGSQQDVGRAITMISRDEDCHLAYCHEELLRLASAGHADTIRQTLRATALPSSPSTVTSARLSWRTWGAS